MFALICKIQIQILQYRMQPELTAIQHLGMIMNKEKLQIDYVLTMVEILNHSYLSCKDIITVLEDIFKNQKSAKILIATQVLEYLIKNCNRNFHQAANRQSFQKSILGLLKRQRGKMNFIKELRSNTENWSRIQSKTLYLIQLWYDAFILEEGKYKYIINNYKILRKQNIIFPPRNVNEKSLLAVQTQSPIFDNIESIAQIDQQKFSKKLKAMGMKKLSDKFEKANDEIEQKQKIPKVRDVNIDDVSEKIAIIRSQQYEGKDVLKVIEDIKRDIEFGKVKPHEEKYWKQIKEAAELLIVEWEEKNAELIKQEQLRYLEEKLGKQNRPQKKSEVQVQKEIQVKQVKEVKVEKQDPKQMVDLLDLDYGQEEKVVEKEGQKKEVNLLDL